MNNSAYFMTDYFEARKRFLAETKALAPQAIVGSWAVPQKSGPDLFVDHFWIPPKKEPKTLLVISSGIHGPEACTGSAIQSMFMNEILPTFDFTHTGLFMVHSMNPFGFLHKKRCTENEVNLNRNFSVSGELFKIKNEGSKILNERFMEAKPVSSMRSKLLELIRFENGKPYIEDVPLDHFIKTTVPGQFERPDHLEYGGRGPEPQTKCFIDAIETLMKDFKDVLGLDLHTGLGGAGKLHLLTGGEDNTKNPELFAELFDTEKDKDLYVYTPPQEEGFYQVNGALNSSFGDLSRADQRVCSLTMEFGTLGIEFSNQMEILNLFVLEHQGHFYGYSTKDIEARLGKENFARAYVDTDAWRDSVMNASRGLFHRVFARLRN